MFVAIVANNARRCLISSIYLSLLFLQEDIYDTCFIYFWIYVHDQSWIIKVKINVNFLILMKLQIFVSPTYFIRMIHYYFVVQMLAILTNTLITPDHQFGFRTNHSNIHSTKRVRVRNSTACHYIWQHSPGIGLRWRLRYYCAIVTKPEADIPCSRGYCKKTGSGS